jgi:hypothetical protein
MTAPRWIALSLVALAVAPTLARACSSCGCTLNSDWASQGYAVGAGLRWDLRYDYFDQDQLRSGSARVARDALEVPNEEEIQRTTVNRNTTVGFDYAPSRAWGLNVQLPYFDRYHSTLAEGDAALSYSHSRGIGDLRLTARYQGFSADGSMGLLFGLKLPTGRTDVDFYAGPQAGEALDRGLQPGTGTTDVVVGAYDFGNLGAQLGYFAQVLVQQPLAAHDGFKPGLGVNFNAGLRYLGWRSVSPQLQFNLRHERRESGEAADVENSGATLAYLSPGLSIHLDRHWEGFAFVQVPVHQHVEGLQLEPRRLYSVGLQYRR